MMHDNLQKLKRNLEQIKFGILKTTGSSLLKLTYSFIVDTCKVDCDGYVWCIATAPLPAELTQKKGFAAQLKYVHKVDGVFIKVTGIATPIDANSPDGEAFLHTNMVVITTNQCLLKLRIEEVHYFKKKSISAYTSFFQAVNIFTFNKRVVFE